MKAAPKGPSVSDPVSPGTSAGTRAQSIVEAIRRDHAEFRSRLAEIAAFADRGDLEHAKTECLKFILRLHAHAKAEEESLYAALLEKCGRLEPGPERNRLACGLLEGKEEHAIAERLAEELAGLPAAEPRWIPKFNVLRRSVENRLAAETRALLEWRDRLSDDEADEVLSRYRFAESASLRDCPTRRWLPNDESRGIAPEVSDTIDAYTRH